MNLVTNKGWQRRTVLFLSGQTVSLFGSSLVQFAIIWYITLQTRSGIMMTLSTLCAFLPQIVLSLFSGVWADRYNRKLLIIFGDALIASFTLALAIIFLLGYREMWLLFVITGIRSVGAGIQGPAVGAFLPQLVPQDKLMRVNGYNSSIQHLVMLLSPAASGAILTWFTIDIIFFIDVVTAAAAILILLLLRVPKHVAEKSPDVRGYFSDMAEGLRYIAKTKWVKWLLLFYGAFMFLVTPAAFLTPLLIARSYGEEYWRLTANELLFSGGAVLGGFIIGAWGGFRRRTLTLSLSCLMFGVFTAALGLSGSFIVYLLFIFLTGLAMPFFNTTGTVLLQEKVPLSMQGRVFGIIGMLVSSAMPLAMVLFGPLGDIVSIELLLVLTGVLIACISFAVFRSRVISGADTAPSNTDTAADAESTATAVPVPGDE